MPGNNEEKSKPVQLFHISQSLFKNKRLKRRRLASKLKLKNPKKRPRQTTKTETAFNGHSTQNYGVVFPETIEIVSTDDEKEKETPHRVVQIVQNQVTKTPQKQSSPHKQQTPKTQQISIKQSPSKKIPIPAVETSIVLSSDENEDEVATQARIFPMLNSETTVQTEVGNAVFELSLTQLKQNLHAMTKKRKKHRDRDTRRVKQRLNGSNLSNFSNLSADLSISLISDDEEEAG